ncbi:MAG: TIGR02117 family protein [Flavobacteriales bacterium]|nr:TIGR02117 family protein [Flavobacteriales bacterium]
MNKNLKRFLKSPIYFVELVIAYLILYQSYMILMMAIPINSGEVQCTGIEAFVISNGVHTDICIPKDLAFEWLSFIEPADYRRSHEEIQYISFGWGDKGFYLDTPKWSDLKISTAFEAMVLNSPTIMHLSVHTSKPEVSSRIKSISICSKKAMLLKDFIVGSFQTDNNGMPIIISGAGYGSSDNFYEANGAYNMFETCNSWTNKALKTAGIRTSLDAFFESGIMRHLN